MGKQKSAGNACVDGVPVPVGAVVWVPALQDGRVSASAAYDGRSGVQGRIFVNGVCSDSMLCEFENDTSTSA